MEPIGKKYTFLGLEIGRIGWWGSLIAFFATPLLSLGYYLWFGVRNGLDLSKDPERWAQFGDYLAGTAGPIIGFASVMLLVATLYHQRLELKEQREQLKRSVEEVSQQNRILTLQGFEQSFFSWLKDYKEQVDGLKIEIDPEPEYGEPGGSLHGRNALRLIMNRCYDPFTSDERMYSEAVKRLRRKGEDITSEDLDFALSKVFSAWKHQMYFQADWLGSMLRTLYGLFRWIDNHDQLSNEEKKHYISIVRARLSDAELRMLFINGMTPAGHKFSSYINKYALFDNLPNPDSSLLDAIKRHPKCPYTDAAYLTDAPEKTL